MDKLCITGGQPLKGTITISGAKNAALPLMCAAILAPGTLTLTRVPDLRDVASLRGVLGALGVTTDYDPASKKMVLDAATISSTVAPYELVRKMRASVLVLGPLAARMGEARVSLPGGCAIGARPVDLHLEGLKQLGAEIDIDEGYIVAKAPQGLKGNDVHFAKVSVGATENLLMAATLAKGTTVLHNAAREPEIIDLGNCLIAMGAKISGLGTARIVIEGVSELEAAHHSVIGDRIEAGTFAIAAAMTDGDVLLDGANIDHLTALVHPLHLAGVDMIAENGSAIRVRRARKILRGVDVMTEPYPGFPTDMQAQLMALLTVAEGAGMVSETVFENRFMHVPELIRMGANITVHGHSALVRGVKRLKGAHVMATDLRASVSLVLAGLVAEGETQVHRIYHLERGYEDIVGKLGGVGAHLRRTTDDDA